MPVGQGEAGQRWSCRSHRWNQVERVWEITSDVIDVALCILSGRIKACLLCVELFSAADLHVQPAPWRPDPELHRIPRWHASLLQVSLCLSVFWHSDVHLAKMTNFTHFNDYILQQRRCPESQLPVLLLCAGRCRLLRGLQCFEQRHAAVQWSQELLGECHWRALAQTQTMGDWRGSFQKIVELKWSGSIVNQCLAE